MEFCPFNPLNPNEFLVKGKFCLEPNTVPTSEEMDLVLVPLVAFDTRLNRIGYGKGFYDTYFNKHKNCLKIGLAFELEKIKEKTRFFEKESKNVILDMIITESMIYTNFIKRFK